MSTFCGKFDGCYKYISLDRFDGENLNSSLYWLSHAHSDHMIGLSAEEFHKHLKTNCDVKIYCTAITKKVLSCMPEYKHLSEFMVCLLVDEPTLVSIPGENEQAETITLTAIAAGHCPGSAMLLLEGSEGTVLYTGDFRIDKGTGPLISALHDSHGEVKEIHQLYCDTTFLSSKALNIASRTECEAEVLRQVKEFISRGSNYHIVLKIKAKLGYENVFRVVYDTLGVRTHVRREEAELYSRIPEISETITTDSSKSQVHACCRQKYDPRRTPASTQRAPAGMQLDYSDCEGLRESNTRVKVVHLSTMWFVLTKNKQLSVQTTPNTVRCCYSFHSSYSEIEEFIRYLNPHSVYANVLPMHRTMQQTQALLNSFLSPRNGDDSLTLEQADSWKSIHEVSNWWLTSKRKSSLSAGTPSKKTKSHDTDCTAQECEQSTPSVSRESTPELSLWSDSIDSEDGDVNTHTDNVNVDIDYDSDDIVDIPLNPSYKCSS